jgi:hypothetical protein
VTTISDRIRALHADEPDLSPTELARHIPGASRQLVNQAIGPRQRPTQRRKPVAPARPMDGEEMLSCIARMGVSRAWLARWFGLHPSAIGSQTTGRASIRGDRAILLRLLAYDPELLELAVRLSAPLSAPLAKAPCTVAPQHVDIGLEETAPLLAHEPTP